MVLCCVKVWCGLVERAVHDHRQVVNLANNWPLLQCEPQLSCSVDAPAAEHSPCSCGIGQLLTPALQACCLRRAFVFQVHVAHREELVGGRPRHRVHEEREVARLRQSSHAAVAHVHRQERADAVVVRCLQEEAPHVGVPWHFVVRGDRFAGGRLRLNSCCSTRRNRSSWSTPSLTESPGLGRFGASSIKTLSSVAATKRKLGETSKKLGPWCDMDQTRHAKLPQERSPDVRRVWRCG